MPSYCAFLGHQPHLSLAELCVLLPDLTLKKQWTRQIITFETEEIINENWLQPVGGTVLIAQELDIPSHLKRKKDTPLDELIPLLLYSALKDVKRKAVFSFRCSAVPRNEIRSLYRLCKTYLKGKGLSSRYIGNERHPAKPGTLLLRGIPGPGNCEIVILNDQQKKELWVGKTCAVQDIEAYTERDMGKPFCDTKTGLMPPKLAQILLNLALLTLPSLHSKPMPAEALRERAKAGSKPSNDQPLPPGATWNTITVWDPFCGTGVIVLEALSRRAHVLASDKTERAVKGCRQNILWLRRKEKTPKAVTHEVWKQNATKRAELPRKPSVIVTETSLGPALTKSPTKKEVSNMIRDAEKLELDFFANVADAAPDVPVVCTFPVYVTRDGEQHFLPKVIAGIEKLGFRITCPNNSAIHMTDRSTLLYLRPDQYVGREVAMFVPPKK